MYSLKPRSLFSCVSITLVAPLILVACGGGGGTADTQAPAAPTLTATASLQSAPMAQAASGAVSVIAEAGSSVTVTFTDAGAHKVTKTIAGSGSTPVAIALTAGELTTLSTDGNMTVSAIATDAAKNESSASATSFTLDRIAPVVSRLATQSVVGNNITLAATASDSMGITGYCFKTNTSTPLIGDACFQATETKAGLALALGTIHTVWAKDGAGNISAPLSGPCSVSGATASSASSKKTVCMMTDKGEMVFELDAVAAPNTVANFLQYVNAGFYSGTTFHRILSTFMVQGGGYTFANGTYAAKPTNAAIALENKAVSGLSNLRGTIAMARTAVADSAPASFLLT